jgi:hypothetical protein
MYVWYLERHLKKNVCSDYTNKFVVTRVTYNFSLYYLHVSLTLD